MKKTEQHLESLDFELDVFTGAGGGVGGGHGGGLSGVLLQKALSIQRKNSKQYTVTKRADSATSLLADEQWLFLALSHKKTTYPRLIWLRPCEWILAKRIWVEIMSHF